ncbi:MAG: hypothetical protein HYV09_06635 [Deltaproteobacteria bacterium]|nr:hypothetical protein [Deltaproteobacteria bacterium]
MLVTPRALLPATLALLLAATTARASLNETLDISAQATRSSIAPPPRDTFDAFGFGTRLGVTLHDIRFGAGFGAHAPPPGERAPLLSAETYLAFAPGGFWELRPFVEIRAHADRFDLRQEQTAFGVGPRFGVLAPLSEYFFVDAGLGMDLVGPERLRGSIAIGLPIPLSHL